MRNWMLAGAMALGCQALAAPAARADDPADPAMRDAANRARDKAIIRQLNENQLAHVRQRDAEYAKGWKAWREYNEGRGGQGTENHAAARARHERDMAAWRRAVSLCKAGHEEYCDPR